MLVRHTRKFELDCFCFPAGLALSRDYCAGPGRSELCEQLAGFGPDGASAASRQSARHAAVVREGDGHRMANRVLPKDHRAESHVERDAEVTGEVSRRAPVGGL